MANLGKQTKGKNKKKDKGKADLSQKDALGINAMEGSEYQKRLAAAAKKELKVCMCVVSCCLGA